MTTVGTLTVSGSETGTYNIALKTGWNPVVYSSRTNLIFPEGFSLHGVSSDFTLVVAYRASDTRDPWKNPSSAPFGNDFSRLAPSWG